MIIAKGIQKKYGDNVLFDHFDLEIPDQSFLCIYGKSGAGKTTLLNMLSLLEKTDGGKLSFDGVVNPKNSDISKLQREKIGYLFQNFGLIHEDTVKDNLLIALKRFKMSKKRQQTAMLEALRKVNLENVLSKKVYQLSGGEQQRVAIARLLLKQPKYVFADEPTGNLDEENTKDVFDLLKILHEECGATVVFVTHNKELIEMSDTAIEIE